MAKETKIKKHKCKECNKVHIDDIGIFHFGGFTYRNENGVIYIDSLSVYKMLISAGLTRHAVHFMNKVVDCKFKDK